MGVGGKAPKPRLGLSCPLGGRVVGEEGVEEARPTLDEELAFVVDIPPESEWARGNVG